VARESRKEKIMKKMTSNNGVKKRVSAKDVEPYLTAVPQDTRAALEKLRKAIKASAPKAEVVISYQIP
jgi:pyruvate/2-oxoglutarate dehydrogenase complex dihydrolipoamide acyltransferase (E2) component